MASQLSQTEREAFQWISQAAFTNPFSVERLQLDAKITGKARRNVEALTQAVVEKVRSLESRKLGSLQAFKGEEAGMMRNVFLFEAYHRYYAELDALILLQTKAGERSVKVPFAGPAIRLLEQRGFDHEEALRLFAIFYQLRRAFYFIEKGLIGKSESMGALRRSLWDAVFTHDIRWYDEFLWNRMEDFSTLLLGETGTGKSAAAAAIGRSGFIPFDERQETFVESFCQTFISLNLSQFPESLIESALFGHRKGAFTGAIEDSSGFLARCSPHGSIFLDEIGDVSVPVQIKLLQLLQDRTYSAVGGREILRFRGRVIAATNRSLAERRKEQTFRDDFYYRLCSDEIQVPTLRQRVREYPGEMDLLAAYLLDRMTQNVTKPLLEFVWDRLHSSTPPDYEWPGNVRELEQALRRILLTGKYIPAESEQLDPEEQFLAEVQQGTLSASELLKNYCRLLFGRHKTYEAVSRTTGLDRRTVKKYVVNSGTED